jgi:hypothetical protein
MNATELRSLMKNVAVGSAATCFSACVVLLLLFLYAKAQGNA